MRTETTMTETKPEEPKKDAPSEKGSSKLTSKPAKEQKPQPVFSYTFSDGTIAEMVYAKTVGRTALAILEGDEVVFHDQLHVGYDGKLTEDIKKAEKILVPFSSSYGLIKANFVRLASTVEEYGSLEELHEELCEYLKRYVVLEDSRFYGVAATYIMLTWVADRFNTLPYLRVVGHYGTGKSRFLEVVGNVCNRAMIASGSISMAAVYRTLDEVKGTLVFDEADFKSSDMSDEIVKILNGGHKKDSPVVRMDVSKAAIKTATFQVFGPKILGSRQNFSDMALESRCITQRLFPMKNVDVPVHLPRSFDVEVESLRNKLLMFRMKMYDEVEEDEDSLGGLEFPRLKQSVLALTSLAQQIGKPVLEPILGFLADYEAALLKNDATDILADILLCIAEVIQTDKVIQESGRLYMNNIANAFNAYCYEDYTERETRELDTKDGPLSIPGQRVSSRKIGTYVDRLGLTKERDSGGIYIPIGRDKKKLDLLLERYGLTKVLAKKQTEREERLKSIRVPKNSVGESSFVEDDEPAPY